MPLHLDIVTPEKKVFSDSVDNVYLPGADGEIGVLPMHAGLVTALKPGELRYLYNDQVVTLAIGSGFAEITQTKVVVLTDMALGEAEIDELSAEEAIQARPGATPERRAQHGRGRGGLSPRHHLQVRRGHPVQAQTPSLKPAALERSGFDRRPPPPECGMTRARIANCSIHNDYISVPFYWKRPW